MSSRDGLKSCRRVVIKVGSSTITHDSGQLNLARLERLALELADLHNEGREVVLITSGAVAAGIGRLGYKEYPKTMPVKQALAAVGQGTLMQMYEKFFSEYGKLIAQVLLTKDDFDERLRYLNARNTLTTLLQMGVIPIINENDTVAVDEIRFGDNDTVSALVAEIVDADLLIILSDIDGVYDDDPRVNPAALRFNELDDVPALTEATLKGRGTQFSSGGMYTKFQAARICIASGIAMVIANGGEKNVLRQVMSGEQIGTLFKPGTRLQARKRWIGFSGQTHGVVGIDEGAVLALRKKGRSLLPTGVISVNGDFERGNIVIVADPDGQEIARGLTNYSSDEVRQIAGHKTSEIEKILGSKDYNEIIHCDNLTLTC